MVSSSWKWCVLALFATLAALVLCTLALLLVHVDQYTNMSTAQVDAQEERYLRRQVAACQQAGGYPQADGTTMYCNVSFQQPDDSWYIIPLDNPNYEVWQMVQPLLVVLAGVLAVIAGRLIYVLFLCFRTGGRAVPVPQGR